jgi:hypothetical protein
METGLITQNLDGFTTTDRVYKILELGPMRIKDLAELVGFSGSFISARLGSLKDTGEIEKTPKGFQLTDTGMIKAGLIPPIYKKCPKCNSIKAIEDFGDNKSKSDGKQTYCKVCTNLIAAERRNNSEQIDSGHSLHPESDREAVLKKLSAIEERLDLIMQIVMNKPQKPNGLKTSQELIVS